MPIKLKPRRIRIELDPDDGFMVGLSVEYTRHLEENGEKIADLPVHIESLAPDSPQALIVMGNVASSASAALLTYQAEVQSLGSERNALQAQVTDLTAKLAEATDQVEAATSHIQGLQSQLATAQAEIAGFKSAASASAAP